MCGHLQDAEDITQETFLSAFRCLDGFREETKLRNWLFTIAANACIRKRRKKKREPDREISLESLVHEGGSSAKYGMPDWSDDPSDIFLQRPILRNSQVYRQFLRLYMRHIPT